MRLAQVLLFFAATVLLVSGQEQTCNNRYSTLGFTNYLYELPHAFGTNSLINLGREEVHKWLLHALYGSSVRVTLRIYVSRDGPCAFAGSSADTYGLLLPDDTYIEGNIREYSFNATSGPVWVTVMTYSNFLPYEGYYSPAVSVTWTSKCNQGFTAADNKCVPSTPSPTVSPTPVPTVAPTVSPTWSPTPSPTSPTATAQQGQPLLQWVRQPSVLRRLVRLVK